MAGRLQGSARPEQIPTLVLSDAACRSGDWGSYTGVGWCADGADACDPIALDRVLFESCAPFVGINAVNAGCAVTRDCAAAQQWLSESGDEVVTVAGTLRRYVWAADVDPADTGAPAEAGQAAAEELIALAESRGLPWLLRASGRGGGRHVLVAGELDEDEWRRWCHGAALRHGVGVQPRRTLRLLAAPHRLGLASPILAGTLVPADLPAPPAPSSSRTSTRSRRSSRRARGGTRTIPHQVGFASSDEDRSRREYGATLARARAGWTARRTYSALAVLGSKAHEQGELAWRRWVWARAVTVVAAERGVTEDDAWAEFAQASRRRARELGRDAWRQRYWWPAREEASQDRPRRRRLDAPEQTETGAEVERVRAGLHAAAAAALAVAPRRPQFRRSVAAAVDALAPVLVQRAGSLAERSWAELARLSRSTLRAVLQWALEHGVLCRAGTYAGGTADCTTWALGPRSEAALPSSETRSTGGTPPPQPPAVGRADPVRLRRLHKRERQVRDEQISALTEVSVQHESSPAAHRTARSLEWQRRWWKRLDADEQQTRRNARRAMLGEMHRTRLSAWLSWLSQRNGLVMSAERLLRGQADADDHHSLAVAPGTVHRGLYAPPLRYADPPTNRAGTPELELVA